MAGTRRAAPSTSSRTSPTALRKAIFRPPTDLRPDRGGGRRAVPARRETLARLAGVYRSSSGDTENRFDGNDVNEYDTYALRAIARWEISDDNVWTFNVHTGQYNGEGPRYHFVRVDNGHYPDDVLPIIGVDAPYDEGDDWWAGSWDLPQDEDIESYGGSIVGVIETDSFTFTSVTGYENVDAFVRYDSDASPLNYVNVVYGDDGWMFSQELRLASNGDGPLSWIGGLYYYEDSVNADNSFDIARFARDLLARHRTRTTRKLPDSTCSNGNNRLAASPRLPR